MVWPDGSREEIVGREALLAIINDERKLARIKATRERFEQESGDLQGIVQLKMLGQGYDFPPITVVVPMRPYGSFGEFYQFIGRGIRVLQHQALAGRISASDQFLDIVYHAEWSVSARHSHSAMRSTLRQPRTLYPLSSIYRS